jgi:hypothetical protein
VVFGDVGRVAQEGHGGLAVGAGAGERELARAAPRAAIVDLQHVPAGPAHGLHQVDIGLVARKAVQEQQGRMRLVARGQVHQGVDPHAAGRQREGGHVGGMLGIANRIGDHRPRHGLEAGLGARYAADGHGAEEQGAQNEGAGPGDKLACHESPVLVLGQGR